MVFKSTWSRRARSPAVSCRSRSACAESLDREEDRFLCLPTLDSRPRTSPPIGEEDACRRQATRGVEVTASGAARQTTPSESYRLDSFSRSPDLSHPHPPLWRFPLQGFRGSPFTSA